MQRTYTRTEVEEFLGALEASASEVIALARDAAADANKGNYEIYTRFRERVEDFESLASLTEFRLRNMGGSHQQDLEEKFTELSAYMLGATISASLHFLKVLSVRDLLPLGSQDLFLRELRRLHAASERLKGSQILERLGPRALQDIKVAEDILQVIIRKAPNLLELEQG